jgi:uncharacterized PurR-regulated membrane protein YhhQ (DUF165 family)
MVVGLVFMLSLIPVIVTQVQDVNTTGWTFTGHEGAATLLLLIPFAAVAGLLAWAASQALG